MLVCHQRVPDQALRVALDQHQLQIPEPAHRGRHRARRRHRLRQHPRLAQHPATAPRRWQRNLARCFQLGQRLAATRALQPPAAIAEIERFTDPIGNPPDALDAARGSAVQHLAQAGKIGPQGAPYLILNLHAEYGSEAASQSPATSYGAGVGLADVIARKRSDYDSDRERVALLAALLHDIGHGPFSHAFELVSASSPRKTHEDWSAEIVRDDTTRVNRLLRSVDERLPDQIGALLKEEEPKDIYATSYPANSTLTGSTTSSETACRQELNPVMSIATGCSTVWRSDRSRSTTIIRMKRPCLCLGPKGLSVAEEYLEARFRLYRMVYMHKTTRAAEKILVTLLNAVANTTENGPTSRDPVLHYLTSETPTIGSYLDLDDTVIWSTLRFYEGHDDRHIAELATRLRNRELYKCVDIGVRDEPGGNLYLRFQRRLERSSIEWRSELIFDDPKVTPYRCTILTMLRRSTRCW